MEKNVKSVIIGRKKREKDDEVYPCFISFFDVNNPHTSGEVPNKIVDISNVHKVVITGLDINYLLEGNDIIINDLVTFDYKVEEGHIHISGTQKICE